MDNEITKPKSDRKKRRALPKELIKRKKDNKMMIFLFNLKESNHLFSDKQGFYLTLINKLYFDDCFIFGNLITMPKDKEI